MTTATPRLLFAAALHARGWSALAVLSTLVAAAAALSAPMLLAAALDDALTGRNSTGSLAALAVVLGSAVLAVTLRGVAAGAAGAAATGWLRHRLVRHVLSSGPAGHAAGDLTNRLGENCAVAGRAGLATIDAAVAIATSVGGVVALWSVHPAAAVAFLLGVPVAMVVIRLSMRRSSTAFVRYQEAQGELASRLLEAMGGARTIRASGTVTAEIARVLAPLPRLAAAGRLTWDVQRATVWQSTLLLALVEVVVLAVAGHALTQGRISPGELAATLGYVAVALGFFTQLDQLFELSLANTAAGRIAAVLDQPVPVSGDRTLAPGAAGRALTFRGVSVRLSDQVLLDRIDMVVPAGSAVAVVGRSGAGKSTLAALAGRLRDPDEGTVLIDDVPVTALSAQALGRAVAYAFDRPALLGDTLQDVLALGRPDATPAEIVDGARAASADDFIRRLPAGYRTRLADAPLSGGEAQRLGLARALVHDADIVVLDDATSSLDTATEAQVTAALGAVLTDRTRLVVAHRASTAARSDLVAWLEAGRLRAYAPHAELWHDPDYRALFQAGSREEDQ